MNIFKSAAVCLALMTASAPVLADDLPTPTGEIILTISGAIAHTNGDGVARFDRAMLEAMPVVTLDTTTIWTEGTQSFAGVSLADVMAAVGASGTVMMATAINDYAVEVPMSDATPGRAVIAYLRNGDAMSVRDKGPLWVVYDYDGDPEFQTEVIYSRSIWQLDRIVVQ